MGWNEEYTAIGDERRSHTVKMEENVRATVHTITAEITGIDRAQVGGMAEAR